MTTEPLPRSAICGIACAQSQMLLLTLRAHDLVEGLVLDVEQRAVIRVHRGVADEDVDLAVMLDRARDQRLDFLAARDVAGNDMGVAARLVDAVGDFLAGVGLAAGDHHLGAELGQQFRRRAADAAAGAGDDGDLAGEIERGSFTMRLPFVLFVRRFCHSSCPGLTRASTTSFVTKTWMAGTSPAMTICEFRIALRALRNDGRAKPTRPRR